MTDLMAGGRALIPGCRWAGKTIGPMVLMNTTYLSDDVTYCQFHRFPDYLSFSCKVIDESLVRNKYFKGRNVFVPVTDGGEQVKDDTNQFVLLVDEDGYFLHTGRGIDVQEPAVAVADKVDDGFFALD